MSKLILNNEIVEFNCANQSFLNNFEYIKTLLNEIDSMMEDMDFIYDEYYNFLSIKDMIEYNTIGVSRYIKYYSFIISILKSFKDLNDLEYEKIYEKFDIFLDKKSDNTLINISDVHNEINNFTSIGKLNLRNMHIAIEKIWQELGFHDNTYAFIVKSDFNKYILKIR